MLPSESATTPLRPKMPIRIPLQPKNTPFNYTSAKTPHSNPNKSIPIPPINYATNNKENHPQFAPPAPKSEAEVSSMDASLADELNAVRQRLDRLRKDKDTTERLLRLRDRIFETRSQEFMLRREFQKQIETEVDRIYRLKQLQIRSVRMSPIRSLREREMQKRSRESSLPSEDSLRKAESVGRSVRMATSFGSESTSLV